MDNKGAEQSARMRKLVCAFVVVKFLKTGFLTSRPINKDDVHNISKTITKKEDLKCSEYDQEIPKS